MTSGPIVPALSKLSYQAIIPRLSGASPMPIIEQNVIKAATL